ncbi:MAG: molybdopterin-guanine dinucleotide biosynthesis protein MobB [Deltaproteobacteria bacterium]|nr:molybdopterin-guanine dinucleotide biosynthesis protein MobB [Deltaproteobacteria bacterium]
MILSEGFKENPLPKIEVFRPEVHSDPLYTISRQILFKFLYFRQPSNNLFRKSTSSNTAEPYG